MIYLTNSRIDKEDERIYNTLLDISNEITSWNYNDYLKIIKNTTQAHIIQVGQLQQLTTHSSAGPLIIILLQVLTYNENNNKKIWKNKFIDNEKSLIDNKQLKHLGILRSEPYYTENSITHYIIKNILCWNDNSNDNDNDNNNKLTNSIIYGLAGDLRGSHVLEIIVY